MVSMNKFIAFIPARGGSKSIPLKNIKEICGKPLIYWAAKAACESKYIDKVYIATDSSDIKREIVHFCENERKVFSKVAVVERSINNASDTATTESAMLEFAAKYEFENIVLIQATSPLIMGKEIDGGIELFLSPCTDSVLSLVHQKRFLWQKEGDTVIPSNYDCYNRPRRQEFDGFLIENGAFYITSKRALINNKNRISGNIRAYLMPEESSIEIDEPEDFIVVEQLLLNRLKEERRKRNRTIKSRN